MVPISITSRMAYDATSAVKVPSHPGQPCRRAQAATGSTAIVSTSASIAGATISAAARMPPVRTTTPMTPSITVTIRGTVAVPSGSRSPWSAAGSAGSCDDMAFKLGHSLPRRVT